MQMFDAAQQLVEQVRHPLVIQLHLDHLTQVGIHQLHHQVTAKTRDVTQTCDVIQARS